MPQKSSVSFILKYESAGHLYYCKRSFPVYNSQPAVCTIMVSSSSTNQGHQHGPQGHHGPRTSTWPKVATQAMNSHMFSDGNTTINIKMVSGSSTDHGYQHVLQNLDINMASAGPRSQTSAWQQHGSLNINMVPGGSVDHGWQLSSIRHGSLSREFNSEDIFISDNLFLLRAKVMLWLGRAFAGRACVNSRLLHTTLLAPPSNDMLPVYHSHAPTPVTTASRL